MADKKDYAAIHELEKLIKENDANFHQWKLHNIASRGTAEYNELATRFTDYDSDLRSRIAVLQGSNVESGPKSIDAVLDELLDKVDATSFALALQTLNTSDPTFFPSFNAHFQNLKRQPIKSDAFRAAITRPQYYPGFVASSPYSYAAPQITTTTPIYRPPAMPIKRKLSPVRDFQKKAGAPFRDFST